MRPHLWPAFSHSTCYLRPTGAEGSSPLSPALLRRPQTCGARDPFYPILLERLSKCNQRQAGLRDFGAERTQFSPAGMVLLEEEKEG